MTKNHCKISFSQNDKTVSNKELVIRAWVSDIHVKICNQFWSNYNL